MWRRMHVRRLHEHSVLNSYGLLCPLSLPVLLQRSSCMWPGSCVSHTCLPLDGMNALAGDSYAWLRKTKPSFFLKCVVGHISSMVHLLSKGGLP